MIDTLKVGKKNTTKIMLKALVSVSLLIFLVTKLNISETFFTIKNLSINIYMTSLGLSFVCTTIAAYRCKYLCEAKKKSIPFKKSYIYYFYTVFYSNFMPSAIGGDLFRIYYLNEHVQNKYESVSIVLFERVSGFFSVIFIATFASVYLFIKFGEPEYLYSTVFTGILLISGFYLIISDRIQKIVIKVLNYIHLNRLSNQIKEYISQLSDLALNIRLFWKTFVFSLFYQSFGMFIVYLYGISLGLNVSLPYYFVFIPMTYLITMIHISFSGIGLREASIVSFFSLIDVPPNLSLSLSLLIYLESIIKGSFGGLILLYNNLKPKQILS